MKINDTWHGFFSWATKQYDLEWFWPLVDSRTEKTNNDNKPARMVSLISAWHYFRCDTCTVKPHDEVPPNKLNLDITSLAPDLYPVPFLKESRIKFLGGGGVWCGRAGEFSGSRRRNLGPCVPSGVLDWFPLLRLTKGSPINQKSQPAPGFGIILNNIKPAPNSTKPGPIPEWI